ncbi:hypothetical protein NL676_022620 [Syzygium grande]|nr:hypothetical protein NL676_022620 [Syzygium grande]
MGRTICHQCHVEAEDEDAHLLITILLSSIIFFHCCCCCSSSSSSSHAAVFFSPLGDKGRIFAVNDCRQFQLVGSATNPAFRSWEFIESKQ